MNNWYIFAQPEIDRLIVVISSLNSEKEILRFSIKKGYGQKNPPHPFPGKEVSEEEQRFAGMRKWMTAVSMEPPRGQNETYAA